MMIIVMIVAMIVIKVLLDLMHGSCRHREPCIDACTCMPRQSVAGFTVRVGSQRHCELCFGAAGPRPRRQKARLIACSEAGVVGSAP